MTNTDSTAQPDEPRADKLIVRWRADFDRLEREVQRIDIRRQVFDALDAELMRHNRPGTSVILDNFLRPLYADGQCVAIRRLCDHDARSVSFRCLLDDMARNTDALTRSWYVRSYVGADRSGYETERAHKSFDHLVAPGAVSVPEPRVKGERDKLLDGCKVVKRYVDTSVAHLDRDGADVTWGRSPPPSAR